VLSRRAERWVGTNPKNPNDVNGREIFGSGGSIFDRQGEMGKRLQRWVKGDRSKKFVGWKAPMGHRRGEARKEELKRGKELL